MFTKEFNRIMQNLGVKVTVESDDPKKTNMIYETIAERFLMFEIRQMLKDKNE